MVQLRLGAAFIACSHILLSHAVPFHSPPQASTLGCGKSLPTGQSIGAVSNVSITSGGIARKYLVFIPPDYNPNVPTPLILSYHGGTQTATQQLRLDLLTSPEFNNASMVVYPQGIDDTWQGVPGVTTNDTQFTTDILDDLQSKYCIDISRIAATGKSDGAGFCNILACDAVLSTRISAFAPVSGAYYAKASVCDPTALVNPCSAGRTDIPFLAFHGGNDTIISYFGGPRKKECLPFVEHFVQEWAARDGLPASSTMAPVANDTVKYSFGSGMNAGLVGLYFELNIGHDWPSTEPNSDNLVAGHHVASYNATPIIMDFFAAHPLSEHGSDGGW